MAAPTFDPATATIPEIDEHIAECHNLELKAYFACDEGQALWYVFEIGRLQRLKLAREATP